MISPGEAGGAAADWSRRVETLRRGALGSRVISWSSQSGHAINLEEPDAFNRAVWDFLTLVEAG